MSRPKSSYTLHAVYRLAALWRRLTWVQKTNSENSVRRRVPLRLEAMEDRTVPTSVWIGPGSQSLAEGANGGITVYRGGGDLTQPLTVNLSIGQDSQGDQLATWSDDYSVSTQSRTGNAINAGGRVE